MSAPHFTSSRDRPKQPSENGHRSTPAERPPEPVAHEGVAIRRHDVLEPDVRSTVSLIIPAKNEARNLAAVLTHLPNCVDEVILVDGRSSDVTRLMAQTCRPDIRIIGEPEPGKGHALRAGFDAASCDVIIAMDADGSMLPEEIPQLVWFLDHGYDFVKGSRFVGGGGSLDITTMRKLGNRFLLLLANMWFDAQLTDLCYGFFGFRRQYLSHLGLCSSGFEIETELTVRAVISGLRIAEVPSLELPRRSGRSNLRSFRDGFRVLHTLLEERAEQRGATGGARMTPAPTGGNQPG
jgi:glycosyltransferase involved in cell wall biosynthesis